MIIHICLNEGRTANHIAARLGRSVSTIAREITKHTKIRRTNKNDCLLKGKCSHHNICNQATACRGLCSKCSSVLCKKHCTDYVQAVCEKLTEFPYVCNACRKKAYCSFEKRLYEANEAHNEVRKIPVSKAGHRFIDYNEFLETYNGIVVQMDCVEGIQADHATLLTLHWPSPHMQIAILMISRFMMPPDFDDFCLALGLEDIAAEEVILAPRLLQSPSIKVSATE